MVARRGGDPESLRREIVEFFQDYQRELASDDLRTKVLALVPALRKLRDLGSSLLPMELAGAARERILYYWPMRSEGGRVPSSPRSLPSFAKTSASRSRARNSGTSRRPRPSGRGGSAS